MLDLLLPYPSVFDRRVFILMHTKESTTIQEWVLEIFVFIKYLRS